MSYVGKGSATEDNPVILTFPFDVQILFFQNYHTISGNNLLNSYRTVITDSLEKDNYTYISENNSPQGLTLKLKDSKTINFYGMDWKDYIYVVGAIGGSSLSHRSDWLITNASIKSWTVPYTRKYYIELYGCGGNTIIEMYDMPYYQSRSSCQSYTLNLQKGITYSISLGYRRGGDSPKEGTTRFGEYSVIGGGDSTANTPRKGAGNLGTDGVYKADLPTKNYSKGTFKESFGWGTNGAGQGSMQYGGPSAIYIKYLGD